VAAPSRHVERVLETRRGTSRHVERVLETRRGTGVTSELSNFNVKS
jgi:hypothetical protein